MRLKEDVGGVSLSKNHVNEQLYTLFRQPLNAVNPKRCSSAFIEELCTYRKREKVMTSLACSLASCFIAVKGKNGGEQHRKAKSVRCLQVCIMKLLDRSLTGRRKKKIKCLVIESESLSCINCLTRGQRCTFEHPAPHKRPKKSYVDALELRISKLEALVGRLAPGYDYNKDIGQPVTADLFDGSRKRKQDGAKPNEKRESFNGDSVSDNDTDEELDVKMQCICVTNTSPDWNRYFGASSNSILFAAAQEYCASQNKELGSDKMRPKFWMDNERMAEEKQDDALPPILPSDYPADLDNLIELFFKNVNDYFPLLHKVTFTTQLLYRKLDKSFAGVVMLVCAIASKFSDNPSTLSPTYDKLFAGRQFYLKYKSKCRRNHVCAPSLNDIQSMILLQVFLQSTPFSKANWSINGQTLALLQDVGYHRQRVTEDFVDDELRRRAFYCALVQDKSLSALFGRCGMISSSCFDVQVPMVLPDEVGTPMEVTVTYFRELISLYTIQDEVLGSLYSLKHGQSESPKERMKQSVTEVSKANGRLHEWIENVDQKLKYNPDSVDDFTHALMANLRIAYHISQVFIYRNYITMPRRSSFRSTSLSITTQASINMINLWQAKAIRNTDLTYADYLISTSVFSASLVLTISACECRKYAGVADIGQNIPEMRYIELALGILRRSEDYNIYNGKERDLLIQLLQLCDLRVDGMTLPQSVEYETSSNISSNTATTPSNDSNQMFYLDMLSSIRSFGNVDLGVPNVDNLDGFLNDLPDMGDVDTDWKSFVGSLNL